MPSDSKPYTFDRVFRIFVTILVFAGVLWLMKYLSDVLIPFASAFLLAYLLNPLVNLLQKKSDTGLQLYV
jgi:predicted PurR-regulated permease PerM